MAATPALLVRGAELAQAGQAAVAVAAVRVSRWHRRGSVGVGGGHGGCRAPAPLGLGGGRWG